MIRVYGLKSRVPSPCFLRPFLADVVNASGLYPVVQASLARTTAFARSLGIMAAFTLG